VAERRAHTVDRYIARDFLLVFVVVLLIIVTLLQSLDLMNEADAVLAAEGAGAAQILRYIGWRAPQLADRFGPFVGLLAALITFARLAQSSEITALRAAGASRLRIIAPMMAVGGAIALTHFAFHELVVVEANARLERWRAQDYAVSSAAEAQPIADIRLTDGRMILRAASMQRVGDDDSGVWRLENLRAYEPEGGAMSALHARVAVHDGAGWRIEGGQAFDAETQRWRDAAPDEWADGPPPDQIVAAALDPDQADLAELARASRAADGLRGAARLETALLHRFTAPAASILMPLLAAIAGFGLHRSHSLLPRIAAGIGLGFAYFVFDNLMVVMGRLDTVPAIAAALAAPLIFLGVGLSLRK
jgi:lipopolysaccharide export system permease protein